MFFLARFCSFLARDIFSARSALVNTLSTNFKKPSTDFLLLRFTFAKREVIADTFD